MATNANQPYHSGTGQYVPASHPQAVPRTGNGAVLAGLRAMTGAQLGAPQAMTSPAVTSPVMGGLAAGGLATGGAIIGMQVPRTGTQGGAAVSMGDLAQVQQAMPGVNGPVNPLPPSGALGPSQMLQTPVTLPGRGSGVGPGVMT
jgi:hypothetical protein